jgi:hypothetical protein
MAYTYESQNEDGYKIVVLPLTIKRGGETSISITKVYVRNYSKTSTLNNADKFNFKLKAENVLYGEDPFLDTSSGLFSNPLDYDINLNPGSISVTTSFIPEEDYYINYDPSVTFIPPPNDFFYGIRGDVVNDEQFLTIRLSYEPIKDNPQIGTHYGQLVIGYLDSDESYREFLFNIEGTCRYGNVDSIDGFDLGLVSQVQGVSINSIIIN